MENVNLIDKNEYLDLVDASDNPISRMSRREIIKAGMKNHRVVNIFIFNEDWEVLVPVRSATKSSSPNCYDFSWCEYVQSGETYLDAATRGLKEELGIPVLSDDLTLVGKLTPDQGVSSFMTIYKMTFDSIPAYNEEEVSAATFMPMEELRELSSSNPELFKSDIPKVLALLPNV
jgi:isopentenyl-diphosphate delta-isomerase